MHERKSVVLWDWYLKMLIGSQIKRIGLGLFFVAIIFGCQYKFCENGVAQTQTLFPPLGQKNNNQGLNQKKDERKKAISLKNLDLPDWPSSQSKWWKLKLNTGKNQQSIERRGNIWIQAQDHSILFEDQIGQLHLLSESDVHQISEIPPPKRLSDKQLTDRLKEVLPPGFKVRKTKNYVFCYWTSLKYAKWVGGLYERMYRSFSKYWKSKGFQFKESDRPKIVLIFKNKAQYSTFATAELGSDTSSMVGHYHLLNHWVVMYDLTSGGRFQGSQKKSISSVLAHPNAIPQVATIVHEATHQLMFHSEMQVRLSDIPLWVSEGLAMYFEAPDLKSRKGWTGIGKVNVLRIGPFRNYLLRRPANSLHSLLATDKRLRNPQTLKDAYAEAWALNYFLLKKFPKSYSRYLKALSKRYPQQKDTPEQRVELFQKEMGMDLQEIDQKMLQFFLGRR